MNFIFDYYVSTCCFCISSVFTIEGTDSLMNKLHRSISYRLFTTSQMREIVTTNLDSLFLKDGWIVGYNIVDIPRLHCRLH